MRDVLLGLAYVALLLIPLLPRVRRARRKERLAREAVEKGGVFSQGPRGEHPRVDLSHCIGCGSCVEACPEGNVLAVVAGKAAIVNGHRCIGHTLCAEACPVGAIEIVRASPSISADLPRLTPEYESTLRNVFVVGELGGLALIKNAVNQGRECVDTIASRLAAPGGRRPARDVVDVCIAGAGPAGISASLRAIQDKLSYVTLEQDEIGGTIAKFPRQKLVMTSPVEFPMFGKFKKLEVSKEELLAFWHRVFRTAGLKVRSGERVEDIQVGADGVFTVRSSRAAYRARAVILAIGRRGTPRTLGIPGEELSKVMYSLIDTEAYTDKRILVVGGGDSAVEAAMGLAHQRGNRVTLSYRGAAFTRIKERNAHRVSECIRKKSIDVILESNPVEIRERSVLLEVDGRRREIPNEYVWIFAGGIPSNTLLERLGIRRGPRDLTEEARGEAEMAVVAACGASGRARASGLS